MQVDFKFIQGDRVMTHLGIRGEVMTLDVSRSGNVGYWIEYLNGNGEVKETYVLETQLETP